MLLWHLVYRPKTATYGRGANQWLVVEKSLDANRPGPPLKTLLAHASHADPCSLKKDGVCLNPLLLLYNSMRAIDIHDILACQPLSLKYTRRYNFYGSWTGLFSISCTDTAQHWEPIKLTLVHTWPDDVHWRNETWNRPGLKMIDSVRPREICCSNRSSQVTKSTT